MPLVCQGTQRQGSLPKLRPHVCMCVCVCVCVCTQWEIYSDLTMGIVGRQFVVFYQIPPQIIMTLTGGGTFNNLF